MCWFHSGLFLWLHACRWTHRLFHSNPTTYSNFLHTFLTSYWVPPPHTPTVTAPAAPLHHTCILNLPPSLTESSPRDVPALSWAYTSNKKLVTKSRGLIQLGQSQAEAEPPQSPVPADCPHAALHVKERAHQLGAKQTTGMMWGIQRVSVCVRMLLYWWFLLVGL